MVHLKLFVVYNHLRNFLLKLHMPPLYRLELPNVLVSQDLILFHESVFKAVTDFLHLVAVCILTLHDLRHRLDVTLDYAQLCTDVLNFTLRPVL